MREILKDLRAILSETSRKGGAFGATALREGFGTSRNRGQVTQTPRKFTYKDLRLLLPFVKPHWRQGAIAGILALVCTGTVVVIPLFFKFLADDAVLKGDQRLLNIIVSMLIGALVVFTVADFLKQVYSFRFQNEIVFGLQRTLLGKLLHLPKSFFDSTSTGYLMSRGLADAFQLQAFFSLRLVDIIAKSLQMVCALAVVIYLNWKLTLLSLGVMPLFILTTRLLNGRARQAGRTALEKTAFVSRDVEESLSGAALIKTFAAEEREVQKLQGTLREAFQANQNRMTLTAFFTFVSGMINAVGMGFVLWYGARCIINKELTIGEMLAFTAYLSFLIEPAMFLANLNNSFQYAFAALERVFELINLVPEPAGQEGSIRLSRVKGSVKFEDVSFSYDGEKKALENISFEVEPGQLVSIVGPSGAGKSTLVNLVLGLYQLSAGRIFYDAVPSTEIDLYSLRQRIGVVSQEIFLFNDSIRNNIRYGRLGASDDEIITAAQMAGSHEFISQLPEDYETMIGENGVKLSVGQRQRLSIARAILKKPDVLILDEATSALDPVTEQTVQKMLREFGRGRTVFVIAHRLATVMMSDLILTLDGGRIVQRGTHRELFDRDGLYRQLCLNQFLPADGEARGYAIATS